MQTYILTVTFNNFIDEIYSFASIGDMEEGFAEVCGDHGVTATYTDFARGFLKTDHHVISVHTVPSYDDIQQET